MENTNNSSGQDQSEQPNSAQPTSQPNLDPSPTPIYPTASMGVLASMQASSQATEEPAPSTSPLARLTGHTRAYLAEYVVLLIVLGTLIFLMNSLFAGIIDSFGEQKDAWYWKSSFAYKTSIGQLAAVLALIPILVLLTKRTGGTEESSPAAKQSSWRKGFLGVFLITMGLTAVGYTVGLIYVIASAASNAGLAVDTDNKVWQALVKDGFAILLFGLSALLYARDYRGSTEGNLPMWRRVHRYGLVVLAVTFALIFAFGPLKKQRDGYVDELVVNDMSSITSKINSYATKNRKLPDSLDNVDLSKEVKTRSNSLKYEYKKTDGTGAYELCATFRTDASKKDKDDVSPLSALSGSSSGASSSANQDDSPANHGKGNKCFKKTASGVRSSSTRSTTPSSRNTFVDPSYDDYNYDDL